MLVRFVSATSLSLHDGPRFRTDVYRLIFDCSYSRSCLTISEIIVRFVCCCRRRELDIFAMNETTVPRSHDIVSVLMLKATSKTHFNFKWHGRNVCLFGRLNVFHTQKLSLGRGENFLTFSVSGDPLEARFGRNVVGIEVRINGASCKWVCGETRHLFRFSGLVAAETPNLTPKLLRPSIDWNSCLKEGTRQE